MLATLTLPMLLWAASAGTEAPAPAAPPATAGDSRVLVVDFGGNLSADERAVLEGRVATVLTGLGHAVVTSTDMRALVSIEADKIAAGCDDQGSSCWAEIANALGARYVVTGKAFHIGEQWIAQLALIDSSTLAVTRREVTNETFAGLLKSVGKTSKEMLPAPAKAKQSTNKTEHDASASAASSTTPEPDVTAQSEVKGWGAGKSALFWTGMFMTLGGVGATVGGGIWTGVLESYVADPSATAKDKVIAYDWAPAALITLSGGAVFGVVGLLMTAGGLGMEDG